VNLPHWSGLGLLSRSSGNLGLRSSARDSVSWSGLVLHFCSLTSWLLVLLLWWGLDLWWCCLSPFIGFWCYFWFSLDSLGSSVGSWFLSANWGAFPFDWLTSLALVSLLEFLVVAWLFLLFLAPFGSFGSFRLHHVIRHIQTQLKLKKSKPKQTDLNLCKETNCS
jgi:hypothetical protein